MGTQGIFKTPSSEAGAVDPYATDRTTMYGALSQCAATKVVAAATVADQQGCLTEMADAGMLQPLLKTLSCCVRDANMANQCAIGEDHKGRLGNKEKPFPIPAGDRATSPNTCRIMYEDTKLHTCGQAESILADPAALKDATSHGMRCIAQMQWTDGATDRSLQLGLPCDKMKDKLCFQGTKCTYPVMTCLLKSDVFSGMIDHCHADAYGTTEPAPAVTFPDEKVSCDIGSQFSGANVPYYCIGISFALILLSYLLIKVWFVVTVAKLLLYVYVVIEAICGFGVTIWSITLMTDPNNEAVFNFGCLGAGLLMLFVAVTFYKGLTGNPCLLNISFLAALIMSIVFLISGFILLFGLDEVCAKAEEMLEKNNVPADQISAVEESLQSSATALTNILLLVGGVAASSVILSLRMKDKLYEAKEEQEQKLVAMDAKSLDKKDAEREKWKQKMAAQVAKEEKKGKR